MFPSPLEVDRFLYKEQVEIYQSYKFKFPSPLEVDRFLYGRKIMNNTNANAVSVPSRGR